MITFNDFKKVELKTAEIISVEDIPGKDKLYKIELELGTEKRIIVAGIKQSYPDKAELEGKKIVVLTNLEPATIAGVESNAMMLAAKDNEGNYRFVAPDERVENGTQLE